MTSPTMQKLCDAVARRARERAIDEAVRRCWPGHRPFYVPWPHVMGKSRLLADIRAEFRRIMGSTT